MALEIASFLSQLDASFPSTNDQLAQGDDHIRLLKSTLKATFPGRAGPDGRALTKVATFTPNSSEIGVIYIATVALTVALPALAGEAVGAHYWVFASNGTVTFSPNALETVNGAASYVLASGGWGLFTKKSTTDWALLMAAPRQTGAELVAAIGALAVQNATLAASATQVGGYPATALVRSVNGSGPDGGGNVAVAGGVTSVNGATGAITAAQIATAANAGNGGAPALAANAYTDHNHAGVYLPIATGNVVGAFALAYVSLSSVVPAQGTTSSSAGGSTVYFNSYSCSTAFAVSGTWVLCASADDSAGHITLIRKIA